MAAELGARWPYVQVFIEVEWTVGRLQRQGVSCVQHRLIQTGQLPLLPSFVKCGIVICRTTGIGNQLGVPTLFLGSHDLADLITNMLRGAQKA